MANSKKNSNETIEQLKEEAERHLRLVEALEYLAKAEEEVATAFSALGLAGEADEMLQRAVAHYHRATQEMHQAKAKRQLELDMKTRAQH